MRIPAKCKLEKLVSRDTSRPVLCTLYLRIVGEGAERKGYLEGTDSYKLARIPVELDEGDTEGFIPLEAIQTARKLKVDTIRANGTVDIPTGTETAVSYSRPDVGQFPNTDALLDVEPARIDGERWRIGLNPTLLAELAAGMGCETVELEFAAVRPAPGPDGGNVDFRPSGLRPVTVRPLGFIRGAGSTSDATGLLMPVRV